MISLIMGTLGRSAEIDLFINSLLSQVGAYQWELIIVDQNDDDRVERIVEQFISRLPEGCEIIHVKTKIKGLSRARNIGLKMCRGSIICFPDDDCVYSNVTLSRVMAVFLSESSDNLVVVLDDTDKIEFLNTHELMLSDLVIPKKISSYNVFRDAISYTIFVSGVAKTHLFDERLGVGCYFGAAEETDYIYGLKQQGWRLLKIKQKLIFHPQKDGSHSNHGRAYSYNLGIGAFFRKNINFSDIGLTMFFLLSTTKLIARVFLNAITLNPMELKWFWSILSGRLRGLLTFSRMSKEGER